MGIYVMILIGPNIVGNRELGRLCPDTLLSQQMHGYVILSQESCLEGRPGQAHRSTDI